MTGSLSMWHQVFAISILANGAGGQKDRSENLVQAITDKFTGVLNKNPTAFNSWQIAWGPVVYNHTATNPTDWPQKLMADNALYVVSDGDPATATTFVVGVAATNFSDTYDWTVEDFTVGSQVAWPYGLASNSKGQIYTGPAGAISTSTDTGVTALRSMTDANSRSLGQFLASLKGRAGLSVTFAGHSLGGALSPTLALSYLCDGTLTPTATQVAVLPTAGATPGNPDFANMFTYALPQTGPATGDAAYCLWNTDVWNYYDVVPHAWTALSEIPGLYDFKHTTTKNLVTCLINTMQDKVGSMVYQPITNCSFQPATPPAEIADLHGFVVAVLTQHVQAYIDTFGMATYLDQPVSEWLKIKEAVFLDLITAFAKIYCSKWL